MKKFAVAALIVGAFILYSLFYHSNAAAVLPPTSNQSNSSNGVASTSVPSSSTPGTTGTSGSGSGAYKDGSYTGSVDDAVWGNVQVKVVIQNSKITSVQFLQYPNDRSRSIEINQYADPILITEAIQAQSPNVDIVTGAPDTSDAFIQSLTDALAQAK
jgi:uncharacterized protein with FMN-binding domain